MKALFKLVLILFLTIVIYPQDGWFWQNPLPTGNPLTDVCFVDANNGWAVGEYGIIVRTTDGGESWVVQSSGKTYHLNGVHFSDANNGTAVGFNMTGTAFGDPFLVIVLRTTDGGDNWIMQSSGADCMLNGVYFTDANNGIVVGGGTAFGGYGTILRTTDGGENWVNQLIDTTTIAFNEVCFTDMNTGTVVGRGRWDGMLQQYESKILRTTDGGKSWIEQNSEVTCQLHSVFFIDNNVGWIVGGDGYMDEKSVILKTTDGGDNWIIQLNDNSINGIYDVCFTDAYNGMAVGSFWKDTLNTGWTELVILRTSDGGRSWICRLTGIKGRFSKLSFTDMNNGTIVSSSNDYPSEGIILRTTDGGENWINQIDNPAKGTTVRLNDVCFTDTNNGTAVGFDYYYQNNNSIILRTTNGGCSWVRHSVGIDMELKAVCFTDANTGTVVGNTSILRTTDAGNHWVRQYSGRNPLYAVCFTDENNGAAVGWGTILKTTDGGNNWFEQFTCTYNIYDVCFTDKNNGTAVGDCILRTTDGGNTWVFQSFTSNGLEAVCFTDANTGTAVGWGRILRTTDGGNNWFKQFSCDFNIYDVCFFDANNGTAVGNYVLRTTDGGNTWVIQSTGTNNEFRGVSFVDATTGWIVGSNGTILHTTNGGVTFVEEVKTTNETPKDFLLYQNYPNPFNPNTSIEYRVGSTEYVNLKIYDVLGNEITTLVNEEKPAGSYEVKWNAEGLSSGVYYYQFKAGNFVATKKLLLLK